VCVCACVHAACVGALHNDIHGRSSTVVVLLRRRLEFVGITVRHYGTAVAPLSVILHLSEYKHVRQEARLFARSIMETARAYCWTLTDAFTIACMSVRTVLRKDFVPRLAVNLPSVQ
jgi:hypothetical protein